MPSSGAGWQGGAGLVSQLRQARASCQRGSPACPLGGSSADLTLGDHGFAPLPLSSAAARRVDRAAHRRRTAQSAVSSFEDPRIHGIIAAASAGRIERDIRTLVGFGTRHTMSDTLSATRGIGAARRWIHDEFRRISAACGGCLEVRYVSDVVKGESATRIKADVNVVNVVAIQHGHTEPNRYVLLSGDIDSRVTDVMNATAESPGANDNASGIAAVLEAARLLTKHRPDASIVYAQLAAEEQGLFGGGIVARLAKREGWKLEAVINNDMVGNISGIDGVVENTLARVFAPGLPPTTSPAERRRILTTEGELDTPSRQLARYIDRVADTYFPNLDVEIIYRLDRYGRGGHHTPFFNEGYAAVRLTEAHEDYTRQHQDLRTENGIPYGDVIEGVNNLLGYRIYWRRPGEVNWTRSRFVGKVTEYTLEKVIIDDYFFGVAAVDREGHESFSDRLKLG